MSKFVLQNQTTNHFISSSSGRVFEIVTDLEDAAFFKTRENAEKALKKMFDKNGEAKVSLTRFVTTDLIHVFTFNSEAHKKLGIQSGFDNAENINVSNLNLIVREVKLSLV